MQQRIKKYFSQIGKTQLVWLGLILALGIFLRTYNFKPWLGFELDQVRDANLVSQVVEGKTPVPLLGPTMRKSGSSKDELFHLGPIYYYFQITSAKLFGDYPDKLAYPDLFFGILALPLFYVFLKKYFRENIALALTGLYSVSFFAIRYARFAWNPNSIPFFVLLFLLSLQEFLLKKSKTSWPWILALGIALGVGIQLHAILLLLFPAIAIAVLSYIGKQDKLIWKKALVVLGIVLLLNGGQLVSELQTNFANIKVLLNSPVKDGQAKEENLALKILNNLDCHLEVNGQIVSSLGSDQCEFSYKKIFAANNKLKLRNKFQDPIFLVGLLMGLLFSLLGYASLIYGWKQEADKDKKVLLGLLLLYATVSFLIMLPIINSNLTEFRYFIHISFLPFFFLGLLWLWLEEKFPKVGNKLAIIVVIFLSLANLFGLGGEAKILHNKIKNDGHSVVLGETEDMAKFLQQNAVAIRPVYLTGDNELLGNLLKPLVYILQKQNVELLRPGKDDLAKLQGENLFFIERRGKDAKLENELLGLKVEKYQQFGNMIIYKLQN